MPCRGPTTCPRSSCRTPPRCVRAIRSASRVAAKQARSAHRPRSSTPSRMRSATTISKCLRRPIASGMRSTAEREQKMYQTTYHRPSSVDEAAAAFAKGTEAKYLAGGHTLIPVMKQRLAAPSDVIDLGKIKELIGIELSADTLTIKAATTYFDIMQSADVKKSIPAIAYLTSVLGDPAVRHRGTIGGSIANNDPAADFPAALVSLGATVKTNKRSISADDFFKGLFTTALEDGEIITAVSFPIPEKAGYAKFRHPASRFALTGVFVTRTKAGDVRVAATGASQDGVIRVPAIEAALKANWSAGALDSLKISAGGLMSDIHGTSDYRANLIKVMAQRAVTAAG